LFDWISKPDAFPSWGSLDYADCALFSRVESRNLAVQPFQFLVKNLAAVPFFVFCALVFFSWATVMETELVIALAASNLA
jgi:hypothetical protein